MKTIEKHLVKALVERINPCEGNTNRSLIKCGLWGGFAGKRAAGSVRVSGDIHQNLFNILQGLFVFCA